MVWGGTTVWKGSLRVEVPPLRWASAQGCAPSDVLKIQGAHLGPGSALPPGGKPKVGTRTVANSGPDNIQHQTVHNLGKISFVKHAFNGVFCILKIRFHR